MNSHFSQSEEQKPPKKVYFATFVLLFFCTMSAADSVGFVPNYLDTSTPLTINPSSPAPHQQVHTVALSSLPELGEVAPASTPISDVALPDRVVIPSIGLDLAIQNPATRDVSALDALLQNGPARHVDSSKLGEVGTMIIFAHSSHLPIVHNKMFQAFNRIPELTTGDVITVRGGGKSYLYSVTSLQQVDASDATVDLSKERGTRLVLVTCDTLTGKSARYMLEADLIGTF